MSDTPADRNAPADPAARLPSLFQVMARVEDQLRFADSKAGFVATLHAFLISPLIYNVAEVRAAYRHWDTASHTLLLACFGAYWVLFLVVMAAVTLTVMPRSRGKGRPVSRAYFGRIAREYDHAPGEFVKMVMSLSDHDWVDEIGRYIVDASSIAAAKHRCVRWATFASAPAIVFWFLTVAILFLANLA